MKVFTLSEQRISKDSWFQMSVIWWKKNILYVMLCMLVFLGKMMSESDLLVEYYPMATQQDSH